MEPRQLLSVSLLKDISGTGSSNPNRFFGSSLGTFFVAGNTTSGSNQKLWRTDGTSINTVQVKSLRSGTNSFQTDVGSPFAELNGKVYFFGDDGTHGFELFVTDGTDAGTQLVKDIKPGTDGSIIWHTNDPFLGDQLVDPEFARAGNRLIFFADDGTHGFAPWVTDGTAAGTQLLSASVPGSTVPPGAPSTAAFNGAVYFISPNSANGHQLWRTDGTATGTQSLAGVLVPGASLSTGVAVSVSAAGLYFFGNDGTHNGLWYSDGTAANTRFLTTVPSAFTVMPVGDGAFFFGNDGATGYELWHTDNTAAGTGLVNDIRAGSAGSAPTSSTAEAWTDLDGVLLFTATTNGTTNNVWRSDGTAAGTFQIKTSGGTAPAAPKSMVGFNGVAYFGGDNLRWWRTDGTVAGTAIARSTGNPGNAALANGAVYLALDDGLNGVEPWRQTDEFAPFVRGSSFRFDTPQHRAVVSFSENVAPSFTTADVGIVDPATGTPLPPGSFVAALDPTGKVATITFPGFTNDQLPDGNYRLTITGSGVSDPAGNVMAGNLVLDFFFLNGDANHDRTVDLTDFTILATNFNGTGKTFGQGDFNYDGVVDLTDFTILASRFNMTLAPSEGTVAAEAATPLGRGMTGDVGSTAVVPSGRLYDWLEKADEVL